MSRRASYLTQANTVSPPRNVKSTFEGLVSVALDDSWSTLEREVALIDLLFGGEIAALFERSS